MVVTLHCLAAATVLAAAASGALLMLTAVPIVAAPGGTEGIMPVLRGIRWSARTT